MSPGDTGAVVVDNVLAFLWVDNGPVLMLTTIHGLHSEEWLVPRMRRRPRATGKNKAILEMYGAAARIEISIPRAVNDYNHNMGGVDTADQLRQYYTVQMRTSRTWVPLFLWLLDTSITNAYIMWTIHHNSKTKTSHRDFRLKLVEELVELSYKLEKPQEEPDNNGVRNNPPQLKRSRSKTFLTAKKTVLSNKRLLPGMQDNDSDKENQPNHNVLNKGANRVQCGWCRHMSLQGGEKTPDKSRSFWHCATCKIPLCLTPGRNCFVPDHSSERREGDHAILGRKAS